jgi:hypothetical protein
MLARIRVFGSVARHEGQAAQAATETAKKAALAT